MNKYDPQTKEEMLNEILDIDCSIISCWAVATHQILHTEVYPKTIKVCSKHIENYKIIKTFD